MSTDRRTLLHLLATTPVLGLAPAALAQTASDMPATPSATEGPFYPSPWMRFADTDNDLVQVAGQEKAAGGEVIMLKGRVLDRQGRPVSGARVEIWQCDANGVYLHTRDRLRGGYDAAFQGFGQMETGGDGRYVFRTIKPVAYDGRSPHIHLKVIHSGRTLTSQLYIDGHPGNAGDGLFRRMSPAQRALVTMRFKAGPNGQESVIDLRLA